MNRREFFKITVATAAVPLIPPVLGGLPDEQLWIGLAAGGELVSNLYPVPFEWNKDLIVTTVNDKDGREATFEIDGIAIFLDPSDLEPFRLKEIRPVYVSPQDTVRVTYRLTKPEGVSVEGKQLNWTSTDAKLLDRRV